MRDDPEGWHAVAMALLSASLYSLIYPLYHSKKHLRTNSVSKETADSTASSQSSGSTPSDKVKLSSIEPPLEGHVSHNDLKSVSWATS